MLKRTYKTLEEMVLTKDSTAVYNIDFCHYLTQ